MKLNAAEYMSKRNLTDEGFQALLDERGFWFHCFEFHNNCTTRGRDPSEKKLQALQLPQLNGKSVIDIGSFDGYFAFQAEALGARHVTACDHLACNWQNTTAPGNFDLVREICSSRLVAADVPVEQISPTTVGEFDVSLFLGVLYHAPDMVEYLRRVKSITKELVVIETLVDGLHIPEPCATFYPGDSLNGDGSNWWGPNISCVLGMLEKVGFRDARFVSPLWDINPVAKIRGATEEEAITQTVKSGRAVFHAFV